MTMFQLRKLSFAIINSTTLLLPAWRDICGKVELAVRMMPRDVQTRWNSTYDVIVFALKYRAAIDSITSNKKLKLRQFELSEEEWQIVADLEAVLWVCSYSLSLQINHFELIFSTSNIKMPHCISQATTCPLLASFPQWICWTAT